MADLEKAADSKNKNMQTEILQKCFGLLVTLEERDYFVDITKDLVKEEIEKETILHKQKNTEMFKLKKQLGKFFQYYICACFFNETKKCLQKRKI